MSENPLKSRKWLKDLVDQGKSLSDISKLSGYSQTNVRHWLKKHNLNTQNKSFKDYVVDPICQKHNEQKILYENGTRLRCRSCYRELANSHYHSKSSQEKYELNKKSKGDNISILRQELGNACVECGYNKTLEALHFHHVDPSTKSFSLSNQPHKDIEELREEAAKCLLLCATCHVREHTTFYSREELAIKQVVQVLSKDCSKHDGDSESTCLPCRRNYYNHRKARMKMELVDLLGGECVMCCKSDEPLLLQFHHKDPSTKSLSMGSSFLHVKKKLLFQEIAKCELLCPNCHVEHERELKILSLSK